MVLLRILLKTSVGILLSNSLQVFWNVRVMTGALEDIYNHENEGYPLWMLK